MIARSSAVHLKHKVQRGGTEFESELMTVGVFLLHNLPQVSVSDSLLLESLILACCGDELRDEGG